jgi:tRNA pseudouridine38-40 synthase
MPNDEIPCAHPGQTIHCTDFVFQMAYVRYFFHIGYNGFNYRGWQRQPGVENIQQVLETTMKLVLKDDVSIMGCGRTDAMVHASQYFFHFDVEKPWDFDLLFRLNKNLPDDIAIFEILPMGNDQHARFDVAQRTYDYFIHTYKDPFLSPLSAFYLFKNIDLNKMKEGLALLTKYDDFRAFCKTPDDYEHTICNVSSVRLFCDSAGDKIRFQISANRFLGRMIRMIIGKLLEVGNGSLSVDEFENYFISKQTPKLITPAYPQGLYLSKVVYPYLDIQPRTTFSPFLKSTADQWVLV